jgi:hypothetical protein
LDLGLAEDCPVIDLEVESGLAGALGAQPARLAKAILLARHCGDQDLERMAVAKLRNRGEEPVVRRPDHLFRQAVADWSMQYAKATGIDLSDRDNLTGKRPQDPRIP